MAYRTHLVERSALKNAIHRCHNENTIAYKNYGARGIRVCDEWRYQTSGFQSFLDEVGPRPSAKHSLDRINNDGHYEPGNVWWAPDRKTQQNNRRPSKGVREVNDYGFPLGRSKRDTTGNGGSVSPMLPHKGRVETLCDWAFELGMNPATIRQRLQRGLSVAEALNPCVSRAGETKNKNSNFQLYLPEPAEDGNTKLKSTISKAIDGLNKALDQIGGTLH